MITKELIKEMKKYRDVHNKEQMSYLSYQLSHKMFNEIIKRLEELEELKNQIGLFKSCDNSLSDDDLKMCKDILKDILDPNK